MSYSHNSNHFTGKTRSGCPRKKTKKKNKSKKAT